MEQRLQTISRVKWRINSKLKIDGILLMMANNRTAYGLAFEAAENELSEPEIRFGGFAKS